MKFSDSRSMLRVAALPPAAANDDFAPGPRDDGRAEAAATPTGGWDAFEVWRTRVRDARRDAARGRRG